ncbi:hypothetical protein [Hydrogenophaga sp.]|uniref:hypothetical protein n=1 Tax=Hydrogenophaga sp. TaxID=1904254 RepID=UPI002615CBAA|nr:hypothetical protein [Hydrogenophaga sp.]MCW5654395.1 hypothetical protein [Hydrogenophaga sp.]
MRWWSVLLLGTLAACGGGGDGGGAGSNGPLVTGAAVKGPVEGASVCVYAVSGGTRGARIDLSGAQVVNGCYVTQADGVYRLALPAGSSGDVVIEASGGRYCSDEQPVTAGTCGGGATLTSLAGQTMVTAVTLPAVGASVQAYATPLTTAAFNATTGVFSAAAFDAQFGTLVGQIVGVGSGLTPATPPTAANSPFLSQLANYLQSGGNWQQMLAALQGGNLPSQGGGGGPGSSAGGSVALAAPFDFSGNPSDEAIMQTMAGEYDVAIVNAIDAAQTGPGKLVVAYTGGDGAVTVTLKDAGGNVLVSRSAPALSDRNCADGRCINLWDSATGYGGGGRRLGVYNYYDAGNSSVSPVAYAQVSFLPTGHLMGHVGTYDIRNGVHAYGGAVPAQFATLAGTYAGTEQTQLCGAGNPVLVDITAGGSIRVQGLSSVSCQAQDMSAQWDGQDDFIAVEPSGDILLKLNSRFIGGSQPGGGITLKLATSQSPTSFTEAALTLAGAAGGVTTVNAVRQ